MKKSKKVDPRAKPSGPRKPRPLRLKVGGVYETRNGKYRAEITLNTKDPDDHWPFEGRWIGDPPGFPENMIQPWWTPSGRIGLKGGGPESTDLVREVPRAKPSRASSRGSKSPSQSPAPKRGAPRAK